MKKGLRLLAVAGLMVFSLSSFMPAKNVFTAAEQQQVSIATPGLFAQSQAFNVDFERQSNWSFPITEIIQGTMQSGYYRIFFNIENRSCQRTDPNQSHEFYTDFCTSWLHLYSLFFQAIQKNCRNDTF